MLTPGELQKGMWIIPHSTVEKDKEWSAEEENPVLTLSLFGGQIITKEQPVPHLVLAVQLPFIVVCDSDRQPIITKIWDSREKNLMEISAEFVQAYSPQGYARGLSLLKAQENTAQK